MKWSPITESSNQLVNYAVNTLSRTVLWQSLKLVHHIPGTNPSGVVCNKVGAKSTSIKTNVNSHGGTRNDSHRGRYVKLARTYIRFVLDWNRRTVMRIHNAEFGLTLWTMLSYTEHGNSPWWLPLLILNHSGQSLRGEVFRKQWYFHSSDRIFF